MKKTFLLVIAMSATLMMQAQHVNSLDSLSTSVQLDSMRIQFANNPAGMVAALQVLQASIDADAKMLKLASTELKEETNYAKSTENYLKVTESALAEIKKSYEADIKNLEKMQKAINDQLNALQKVHFEDQEYASEMQEKLKGYLTTIHDAIDEINSSVRGLDDQLVEANRQKTNLESYKNEINVKQEALKNETAQNKSDLGAIKNEMKAWKQLIPKQ